MHFWPLSSLVYGIRIDYLSPTLYFIDILIISFIILKQSSIKLVNLNSFFTIFPIIIINLVYSANPLASLAWSLHLSLYMVFVSLFESKIIKQILLVAMLLAISLGAAQVYLGRSIGGLVYYLGERTVSVGAPNIALGSFFGEVGLRAYGTFSHPNIMAGWLIICLLIILHPLKIYFLSPNKWLVKVALALSVIGVLITQSRAAAISLFGLIIPLYFIKTLKLKILYFAILLIGVYLSLAFFIPARAELSSSERQELSAASMGVVSSFPVFGAGFNSAIYTYPQVIPSLRHLQPDHNSITLLISWIGIFGIVALIQIINLHTFKKALFYIIPLMPLVLFDHYLLTSPQGLLILCIYLHMLFQHERSQSA